jgi:DNA-binding SARP family transcriptional activator/pimeloyl-ACP methyl ester carboxylesterase
VRISLLGPLRLEDGPGASGVAAAKERSLLSALALSPGSVVSTESLIGALWGHDPPAAARKTLQTYVWNLRQALGTHVIATEPPGYRLVIRPDDVDVSHFRALVREGEECVRRGATEEARASFAEAVSLWRGDPFPGVASHTGLANEGVRLKEEYLSALEARLTAEVAGGRNDEVVGELEALVREHPFRERLWGHLMVALYRCGRQADALATYQRAREILVSELGLEPGGDLRRLESAILNQDPALDAPARPPAIHAPALVRSPVRYARCRDGVSVAFQVAGSGPIDILAVAGFVSHLDIWWNAPTDRLVRRLTSMGRLISFDKRGMGLSDRPDTVDAEDWVEDALAVLDAVGSQRAVILGVSAGALTALKLASRYPDRVQALAIFGGFARTLRASDYEVGLDPAVVESFIQHLETRWGTGVAVTTYAGSRAKDPFVRDYWTRYQLLSATPSSSTRFLRAVVAEDVREILPTIRVPTLVVHPERDVIVPVGQARYIADHIPGAEFVGLDSDVHLICVSDVIDELTDEIDAFIRRVVPVRSVEKAVVTALVVHGASADSRNDVDAILERFGGRGQRPVGTAIFESPGRAIRCADAVVTELRLAEPEVRIGLHSGECELSDLGFRGLALDVATELASQAGPGGILATQTVRDLVAGSDFEFRESGWESSADSSLQWRTFSLASD